VELICDLPHVDEDTKPRDSLLDETLFLISTSDPWYGDILLYLHTQRFQPDISREEHVIIFAIILTTNLSSVTLCITVVLILSYDNV
jgi:hypothetical protein